MPILMKVYLLIFAVIVTINLVYSFKKKFKAWLLIYEIINGSVLIFMTASFWEKSLEPYSHPILAYATIGVILFDFYYTIWAHPEKLSDSFEEVSTHELDIAKALSILLTAPAYVTSALVCIRILS